MSDAVSDAARIGYPTLTDAGVTVDPAAVRLLPRDAAGLGIATADGVLEVLVDHLPSAAETLALEKSSGCAVTVTVTSPEIYARVRYRAQDADPAPVVVALAELDPAVVRVQLKPGVPPQVGTADAIAALPGWGPLSVADVAQARDFLLPAGTQGAVTRWAGRHWRVSCGTTNANPTLTLRRVADIDPRLATLGLPAALADAAELRSGLVLLASGAGQGRTSTWTGLLDRIASTRSAWITAVTAGAEQAVSGRRGDLTHRLLGVDAGTVADAVRQAVREGSDVVAVDVDRYSHDDVVAVTQAALAGVLVLATVPATGVCDAVVALLSEVPDSRRAGVQEALAAALRVGFAQALLPAAAGGLTPAVEVCWAGAGTASALRAGNLPAMRAAAATGDASGRRNVTLPDAVSALVAGGRALDPAAS